MKKKSVAVVIVSNGPGELTTWVKPVVNELNKLNESLIDKNNSKVTTGIGNEWSTDWTVSQEYFNIMDKIFNCIVLASANKKIYIHICTPPLGSNKFARSLA